MQPLKLGINEERREDVAAQAYWWRRLLRTPGVRPALYALGFAGLAWLAMTQLPVRQIERGLFELAGAAKARLIEAVAMEMDLGKVVGAERTHRQEIAQALGLPRVTSWIAIDIDEARDRVEALGWVVQAAVRVDIPDRIDVTVVEQTAEAVWQIDGEAWLLTASGEQIARAEGDPMARGLPVLRGAGVEVAVGEILAFGTAHPALLREFRWFRRIGRRRWDGELRGGITISFPEGNLTEAAERFVAINRASGLLERDIAAIDLRNPHAIAIRYRGADLERFLERLRRTPGSGQGA